MFTQRDKRIIVIAAAAVIAAYVFVVFTASPPSPCGETITKTEDRVP